LWWFSVPLVIAFVPISLRAKVQPNWPAPAYISGLLLSYLWLKHYWSWRIVRVCFVLGLTISVGTIVLMRFPQLVLPVFHAIVPEPSEDRAAPVRNVDPTARLRGWKYLAAEVDRIRDQVKCQTGQDAELATMVWTVPGELAFYCRGNPHVYTFGPCLADRASQYDLWRPNPIRDAQAFAGRTFVYVGEEIPGWDRVFEQWNGPNRVDYRENGVTVGSWKVWIGTGFRGFSARPNQKPRY
jgi:hypothetical protein